MDITDKEVESLKFMLKSLRNRIPDERNAHRHFYLTFSVVRRLIRIFVEKDNKKAEEILAELLNHENEGIQFLALCALLDAQNREIDLTPETYIKMLQFRNNPVNQRIWDLVFANLKADKAPFN